MLECVVNISEGRDRSVLQALRSAAEPDLLDVHSDPDHNRSVFTLVGTEAPRRLATEAVACLDISRHAGVHPRLGVVDVVPFVPLSGSTMNDALAARDEFARWAATTLGVPCFLYGPERSLPEVRRNAWKGLTPDVTPDDPPRPHPSAGAMCVGARDVLVAWNVWLDTDLNTAREIARRVRTTAVRTLGLRTGSHVQVSVNLVEPVLHGPDEAWDAIAREAESMGAVTLRSELVGLVPEVVLSTIDESRWPELDLSRDSTIESRLRSR